MRVLHAIHDFLPRHQAGAQLYVHDLAEALAARGHEVHILCAEFDPTRPHGHLMWRSHGELPVTELINNWRFGSFAESTSSPHLTAQLRHVLRAICPDILHVHSLFNLSFELPALAAGLGIPTVATVHDYTLVCPSGGQRVHLAEAHVCIEIDPARCARCFPQSPTAALAAFAWLGGRPGTAASLARVARAALRRLPRLTAGVARAVARRRLAALGPPEIEARLAAARAAVAVMALVVAPSRSLAKELSRLGLDGARVEVSDYGFAPLPEVPRTPGDERLRLGFVGTPVWHKGVHVLLEALRELPPARVDLEIVGCLDTFPDYAARLKRAASGLPVRFTGSVPRARVAEIYARVDVLVVPSLWPENSPLVIHEAFQAGVPVVGARSGGIADLVENGVNGLLYEPFSPAALAAALRRLLEEPGLAARLAAGRPRVKTIDEDSHEWTQRYARVLAAHRGTGA